MEEGIGRGGYRVLAVIFLAVGLFGLACAAYAFVHPSLPFFNAVGFVFMGVALLLEFGLVWIALGRAPAVAPQEPRFAGMPAPTATAQPVDFEFAEAEPQPQPEGDSRPAGPRMPPRDPQFPRAARVVGLPDSPFDRLPPPDAWAPPEQPRAPAIAPPPRRARSGLTMGEKRELEREGKNAPRQAPAEEEVAIPIAMRPARTVPPRAGVPTVLARPAAGNQDPDWVPEGMTRGVCSKCKTVLLAPKQRPVNVRCPRCDKITLLTK